MTIAVIDSGVANLASVAASLARLELPYVRTADVQTIRDASHVILPGVGAAPAAMRELQTKGLIDTIRTLTQPVLGICLGMQLLFDGSEEGAEAKATTPTLGLIEGFVQKLPAAPDTPLPHMGWNEIDILTPSHALFDGIDTQSFMYFVHSFAAPVMTGTTLARCTYGAPFTAVCGQNNFYGCQFHPERSGAAGARLLRNFANMKGNA